MKGLSRLFAETGSRRLKRSNDEFGQQAIAHLGPRQRRLKAGGRGLMQQARPHGR